MRTLILALIPGLLLGCGDDTTATSLTGEATSSSDTGEPTTGNSDPTNPSDPSVASNASDPSSATTSPGTVSSASDEVTSDPTLPDPTTTTASSDTDGTTTVDTTGDTTDGTTDTTDGTTGGGGLCGQEGPEIDADLVHVGNPMACGALEFAGQNPAPGVGPVYELDGCPCGANCLKPDPWTLTLDVPLDWLPGILPACPRIVVERQMGKGGCELVGVAIWDAQEPDGAPAVYHAGSLLGPIAAAQDELTIKEVVIEECECDGCCNAPTLLDLEFTALKSTTTVPEGQTGVLGDKDLGYDVINFQSHYSGICDDSPDIDWVARRTGKP